MSVYFHNEDLRFHLEHQEEIIKWLLEVIRRHSFELVSLDYIFCSDEFLKQINNQYLSHDYYTDVITFDNSDEKGAVEGDIFISIDRVKDNAQELAVGVEPELHRVMVHGLLHLLGMNDKSEAEQKLMREKEDEMLTLLKV